MAKKIPPFYENFDNTHCAQCTLRGILEYFEPEEVWSWEEWDEFTGKEEGKGTWPYRAAMNMTQRGYTLTTFSVINLERYLEIGVYPAMVELLGQEIADYAKRTSDLSNVEAEICAYLADGNIQHVKRTPTIEDMRKLLADGYLLSCFINAFALIGKPGMDGHLVLVYAIDDNYVYMQDSGKPPMPECKVTIEKFIKASTTPTPEQWAINAYKLEKKHA